MEYRKRICGHCGNQFEYPIRRGSDRKYCSDLCGNRAGNEAHRKRANSRPECKVEGCDERAVRVKAGLCEKHYMRLRRRGTFEKATLATPGLLQHSEGYLLRYDPDHPLSGNQSRVYEHRAVFYEHHGAGPFECHWCGTDVTWDDMHVDHVDADTANNDIRNLVASCPGCNIRRGFGKMAETMRAASNRRYTVHGLTMCLSEWARFLGVSVPTIEWRLANGWHMDDAFSLRRGVSGPPSKNKPSPEAVRMFKGRSDAVVET